MLTAQTPDFILQNSFDLNNHFQLNMRIVCGPHWKLNLSLFRDEIGFLWKFNSYKLEKVLTQKFPIFKPG